MNDSDQNDSGNMFKCELEMGLAHLEKPAAASLDELISWLETDDMECSKTITNEDMGCSYINDETINDIMGCSDIINDDIPTKYIKNDYIINDKIRFSKNDAKFRKCFRRTNKPLPNKKKYVGVQRDTRSTYAKKFKCLLACLAIIDRELNLKKLNLVDNINLC